MKFYIGQNQGRRYEAELESLNVNYKRKEVALAMNCYEIDEDGNKKVGEAIRDYRRLLIANNTTAVDPTTGDYLEALAPDENGQFPSNIALIGASVYPAGAIGEFDYFMYIHDNVDIKVKDLELATIIKNKVRLMPDGLLPEEESEPEEIEEE